MRIKSILRVFLLSAILIGAGVTTESCKRSGSKTYKGKIKKNKPIPCPVKDC